MFKKIILVSVIGLSLAVGVSLILSAPVKAANKCEEAGNKKDGTGPGSGCSNDAWGGASAPKEFRDSGDVTGCEVIDASDFECHGIKGVTFKGSHKDSNGGHYYYDPSSSDDKYDTFIGDHNEAGILVCDKSKGYEGNSCYIVDQKGFDGKNPGANYSNGERVVKFDNTNIDQGPDDKNTCNIKMFKDTNTYANIASCKAGWGSHRDIDLSALKTAKFVSGYAGAQAAIAIKNNCDDAVGLLSFIICPVIGYLNNTITSMIGTSNITSSGVSSGKDLSGASRDNSRENGLLVDMLSVRPLLAKVDTERGDTPVDMTNAPAGAGCVADDTGYTCAIKSVWTNIKNVTLGVFIVIFLIIIFANTTSIGLDNYTIKKMLPRLIASAILIQFSLLIVSLAVDFFNVIGTAIGGTILNLIPRGDFCSSPPAMNGVNSAIGTGIGVGLGISFTMLLANPMTGPLIGGIGILLILILIVMVGIALISAFFALMARSLIIFGLVITSPIAMAAWVLPGTEKYFKLWRDNLLKSLAMFPLAIALLALAVMFSTIVLNASACDAQSLGDINFQQIMAALVPAVALMMLPKTFKWGGNLTSAIAGGIMNAGMRRSKAFGNAAKNTGKNAVKRGTSAAKNAGQDRLAQSNFGKNTRTGRMLAGGGIGGFLGTAGGRQKVAARGGAAQTEADKTAGNLIRQMEENNRLLNDPHANLSPGKAQQLHNENARIHNQLFGAGASPAMQAAGIKAIANDHNALIRAQASMGQANFEKAMVAGGVADTAIGTLQRHAMSFADGSAERTAIQNMYTGASTAPEVRAAGIKAMTAAKDGNGLIRAHQAVTATQGGHQAWQDAVSRSGVSGADMAEAISRSTAGIVSPTDSSKPASIIPGDAHYSEEKARAYTMLTGASASPEVRSSALGKFAETGNQEGIEAVRQGVIAANTVSGVYNEAAAKAEWDRAVSENHSKFDNAGGHLRQFTNQARADELGKLDNPAFAKLSGREQKVLTSPGMMETLPSRTIVDATPQNRHEISGDARINTAQWAHGGANMVDDDGQPVITAARRAAELRHAGDEARAQAIEQKAADFRTVLDTSGNWIDSGGTTPPTTSTSSGSSQIPGQGMLFDDSGQPTTPPGVGSPYGNPANPPTTGGSGAPGPTPDDPPIMSFDPVDSDLDPTYGPNKAAQTQILQDRANGATAQGATNANLVGEAINSAPTENTTVAPSIIDDVITGTTAGAAAGTVASGSEAGWGIGAELARYEMERRAKDAASKAREANEAQGARIDSLKKSQDRQARGQTHKDARGNEISGPSPDKETPNE